MGGSVNRGACLLSILLVLLPAGAHARDVLGVFEGWGVFRDAQPLRCYAISSPTRSGTGALRSFASIATWPGLKLRGQLHVRLRNKKQRNTPVWLTIGERRFLLASGGADAWAPDAGVDAAIIAAMRGASSMNVEAIGTDGRRFAETYRLRGAATAIDAAALGCIRPG
jgi:hypothetical protein